MVTNILKNTHTKNKIMKHNNHFPGAEFSKHRSPLIRIYGSRDDVALPNRLPNPREYNHFKHACDQKSCNAKPWSPK